jgi:hypothetical protein
LTAFGASVFATAGAGTLVAAGVGAEPNCTDGVADADESSLYSHAALIVGARPKTANAVNTNTLFMASSSQGELPE